MSKAGLHLHPFRGLRYAQDRVSSLAAVTSPPYDVVVRPDGVHHLETAEPYNFVRLILPQAADPVARHRQAAGTLRAWRDEGVLALDERPALYAYEQRHGDLLQRGLIGALDLDGPVLPHEGVVPEIVADRAELMREAAANFEPLLLTYRGDGTVTGATAVIERTVAREPLLATTTEDGVAHRLWAVTDPAELAVVAADLGRRDALIADGHHRWATYLQLRGEHPGDPAWARGLVLLVDSAQYPLRVRAIHRVLPRLALGDALARLNGAFRTRTVPGPLPRALAALHETPGNAFLLASGPGGAHPEGAHPQGAPPEGAHPQGAPPEGAHPQGAPPEGAGPDGPGSGSAGPARFQLLDRPGPGLLARTVRSDRPETWRRLDATVLHSTLLDAVWRIPDQSSDISYLHSAESAVHQASQRGGTAVLLRAVTEETVRELAGQGVTMPRKATSFGPKPASGLVLRPLDDGLG